MAAVDIWKVAGPLSSLAAAAGGIFLLRNYFSGGVCRSEAKLDGKTVIVTGANTGIGRETALDLAGRGARVILACRNVPKAQEVADEILKKTGNSKVLVKELDLASLKSVRNFARDINETEERLDILINNAGIMRCPYWKTEDGFEMQLGVNHLGHFLLTNLLLDLLQRSQPSRIINVSSLAHTRGKIRFDDLQSEKEYNPGQAYAQSKLANVLFTRELSKKLEDTDVIVASLHPGAVKTELGRHLSIAKSFLASMIFAPLLWLIFKTSWQGAQTSIHCAVSNDVESGLYYSDCKAKEVAEQGKDDAVAKKLWEVSADLVGLESTI
ncbi:retinol dehydrogenase 13-like [Montipora capricornis]|uniref:retinol dehydrogenase 13-like n=1 Tax=Montipora capricornis TaxID=246305 RepID=UPI0035F10757